MELIFTEDEKIIKIGRLIRKSLPRNLLMTLMTTYQSQPVYFTQNFLSDHLFANQSSIHSYIHQFLDLGFPIVEKTSKIQQNKYEENPFQILQDEFTQREGYYKLYSIQSHLNIKLQFFSDSNLPPVADLGSYDLDSIEELSNYLDYLKSPLRIQILDFLKQRYQNEDIPNTVQYKDELPVKLLSMSQSKYSGISRPVPLRDCRKFPMISVKYPNRIAHLELQSSGIKFRLELTPTKLEEYDIQLADGLQYAIPY